MRVDRRQILWTGAVLLLAATATAGGRVRTPPAAGVYPTGGADQANRAAASGSARDTARPSGPARPRHMLCDPIDAVLVMDRSGSMSGERIVGSRQAGQYFLTLLDPALDRAALVSFNHTPTPEQSLTSDFETVDRLIRGLTAGGGTDIAAAIDAGQAELTAATGRPVIVLITDGFSDERAMRAAAANARALGTEIFVIAYEITGWPLAIDVLREVASSPNHLYVVSVVDDLRPILEQLHMIICLCGDGTVDPGEDCDDGNDVPGDGCTACRNDPVCGDGVVEPWEMCDDGSHCDDGTPCDPTIPPPGDCAGIGDQMCIPRRDDLCDENCVYNVPDCGNGVLEIGEQCDDGNNTNGDGCSAWCDFETCPDGVLDPGEQCDDGNMTNGDGCSNVCLAECVDSDGGLIMTVAGTLIAGVSTYTDNCPTATMLEEWYCGPNCFYQYPGPVMPQAIWIDCTANGYTGCVAGACVPDDGRRDTPACNFECGNGTLDPGEVCDDGNTDNGDGCDALCQPEHICGDGILHPPELCDDGNNTDGDGCSAYCTLEGCGDGTQQPWELCDDGNTTDGDGCSAECLPEGACGDGNQEPDEECDATPLPTDQCTAACLLTYCGDSTVQAPNGDGTGGPADDGVEQCDDGNTDPADRCTADCVFTTCGDGIQQGPNGEGRGGPADDGDEACDDGNTDPTDQCTVDCTLTSCGDGVVQSPNGETRGGPADDGDEACDDGNTDPTDQCTVDCILTSCGDGIVQSPNGEGRGGLGDTGVEQCDDGNTIPGDGCTNCVIDIPLSVTWDYVRARCTELGAVIEWSTLEERDTHGFQVLRRDTPGDSLVPVGAALLATGAHSRYQVRDPDGQGSDARWYLIDEICSQPSGCSRSPAVLLSGCSPSPR